MAARRREQTRSRWITSEEEVDDQLTLASPAPSPLASLESARRREAIRRLLNDLPEAIGETMALHLILGHTAREISLMTQVPVNTVWSRLRLGRKRLRERLAEDEALGDEFRRVAAGRNLPRQIEDAVAFPTFSGRRPEHATGQAQEVGAELVRRVHRPLQDDGPLIRTVVEQREARPWTSDRSLRTRGQVFVGGRHGADAHVEAAPVDGEPGRVVLRR